MAAQDRDDRHQQHPPLREADASPHPAIRQRLEEADQIACGSWRGGGLGGQDSGAVPAHGTVGETTEPGPLGHDSNRPWGASMFFAVRLPIGNLKKKLFIGAHIFFVIVELSCFTPELFFHGGESLSITEIIADQVNVFPSTSCHWW